MASGGQQHYSQLHRDPETAAGGCESSTQADTPAETSSRVGGHQTEQETPGEWEAEEGESEQPSSLTDNLSQRVQDVVGAENERGAGDDPNNYPLHSTWTFWFDWSSRSASSQDFFANLKKLCSITTIKAFWCLYNNVVPVEQLQERESYHLMRGEDRRPVWEDLNNIDGGFWAFKVHKEDTQMVWQELLLAAIGEQFSECLATDDEVCGISVKIRGQGTDTIQIWNINSEKHHEARVIQKVKALIPSIEINEFYQSSKMRMSELANKPPALHHMYRGGLPPRYPPRYFPPGHGVYSPHYPPPFGARYPPPPLGPYPPLHQHFRSGPPGPRGHHSHSRPAYNPPS